ncbi:MAG: hypothetical protein B6D55_04145 [Candidatus Omnitrophica bacterium 4484_70.2]|nr:MAG: hypothetical protein B6D55_04145 [Candidatus Omnitrophica bacterium 4484_70.2]
MKEMFLWIIVGVFFIFTALFSCAETVIISINMFRLKHLEQNVNKRILRLLKKPSKLFSTILVGTNISIVSISCLVTYWFIERQCTNPSLWATLIVAPSVLLFAEIIPKRIGRIKKDVLILRMLYFVNYAYKILFPFIYIFEKFSNFLSLKIIPTKEEVRLTKEDLLSLMREIRREGALEEEEVRAIEDIFDFGMVKIKDVMIPWKKVVYIDKSYSNQKVLEIVKKYKFTRYPVVSRDEIIGVLNIFDYFYKNQNWQAYIRPIMKVGKSERLDEVFFKMQKNNQSMACIVKGKKVIGVITLQDLMEEIISNFIK